VSDYRVAPIQQAQVPVGTIAEAQAQGLDITQYNTCAKRNPAAEIKGCPWYDKCRVSAKGESGPRNYGIEIIKGKNTGGGFVRLKNDCMWIADHMENVERNGGSFKIIAEEGESFEVVEGAMVLKSDNTKTTFQGDPMGIRKRIRRTVEVPKFMRPEDNEALMLDVLRAESMKLEKERRADENRARNYGVPDAITPVDKRDARGDGGRKATGGGKP